MKNFQINKWIVGLACSLALGITATPAFADSVFYALPAGSHSLWLPGIGTDFVFTNANPGIFTEKNDGTATLTGMVVSNSNSGKKFSVSVNFINRTNTPPPGSPKKELPAGAYVENGGTIDTNTWHYYTPWGGTLTGLMDFSGAEIDILQTGPAFQVGVGANGKNLNLGGSGWLNWAVTSQPTIGNSLQSTGQGDWNLDFQPVPEPSTIMLLGSGLIGIFAWQRRQTQNK